MVDIFIVAVNNLLIQFFTRFRIFSKAVVYWYTVILTSFNLILKTYNYQRSVLQQHYFKYMRLIIKRNTDKVKLSNLIFVDFGFTSTTTNHYWLYLLKFLYKRITPLQNKTLNNNTYRWGVKYYFNTYTHIHGNTKNIILHHFIVLETSSADVFAHTRTHRSMVF